MNLLKRVFAFVGLDVRWIKNVRAHEQRAYKEKWAESHRVLMNRRIRTVLDIGANTGQFAQMIALACPHLKALHSFEPLADCQVSLRQALSGDNRHFIHNFGFGNKSETVLFNHAKFSPCSSILTPRPLLIEDHPDAGIIHQETVEIRTLDEWAADNELEPEILIKIDVQGYENHVISGGANTLKTARFVIVEVPFSQLYDNQPMFHEVYMMLYNLGFEFKGTTGQNVRKLDGNILEADALFENMNLESKA